MMKKQTNEQRAARRRGWLKRKGLELRDVAEAARLDYGTVIRWFENGSKPRSLYRAAILAAHPDFPI